MNILSKQSIDKLLQFILTLTLILLSIFSANAQYLSSNDCGSNQEIDVYMKGVLGQSNPSISIGSVSTATKLLVTVWIEANDCSGSFPSSITVTNGSQSFTVGQTNVTQSVNSNVLEKLYRATINNPTSTTVSVSGMGSCTSTSISVQKVRAGTGRASFAREINKEFDESNSTYTMNIGNASIARNISVLVPIHEKSNDGRIARVEVWGNGVSLQSSQITTQNKGNEAGLITINLSNVPASTTQLNVKIISPSGNGDSFGVGIIATKTTSACCSPTTITPYVSVNNGTWIGSSTVNICAGDDFGLGTQIGLQSGMVLTKPNGSVDNSADGNSYFSINNATTSSAGIYTITYTNSAGCVSTQTYTVNITNGSVGGSVSPSTQTICQGTNSVPTTHTLSGHTGTVQRWEYKTPTGNWTNWNGAGSSTAPSSCCFTTVGTWQVRAILKSGNCSEVASSAASITVTPSSVGGTISSSSNSVCASTSNFPAGFFTLSGHTGTIERWEWSTNNSNWFDWNGGGSTSSPSGWINNNATFYVRARIKNGSCSSVYSSVKSVTVTASSNITNAGTISGGGNFCSSIPSSNNTVTGTAASGGSGGTIEYLWQYQSRSTCSNTWSGWVNWVSTQSITSWNYTGSLDHKFRRGARRVGSCGTSSWLYSNEVTFDVHSPATNGGTISGTQTSCGSFNPTTITSSSGMSGGCGGTDTYQWQYRNGTSGSWIDISGATSTTYNPSTITQTRQYRRNARRNTCTSWISSNVITKTVNSSISISNVSKTNPTCSGGSNSGSITVTGSVSSGTLEYRLNNGSYQNNNVFTNLGAGTYTVQVRQVGTTCTENWNSSMVLTNPNCSENCTNGIDDDGDGLIDCADSDCKPTISNVSKTNPTCSGGSNSGSITVTGSVSSGTLEYRLNNGSYQNNSTFTNLAAGTYTVQVRHVGTTCTENWSSSMVLTNPNCSENCTNGIDDDGDGLIDCADSDCKPTISNVSKTNPTCPAGSNNGSITVTASVSNGTLEYRLNNGSYQNNSTFTNLAAGTYTVQVRQVGTTCTAAWDNTISLVENLTSCAEICGNGIDDDGDGLTDCADSDCSINASATSTNETCSQNNGSLTITFSDNPNQTDLEFSTNGGSTWNYTSPDNVGAFTINNLSSGNYNLRARWDDNSCPITINNNIVITNNSSSTACNPSVLFQKSISADTARMNETIIYTFTITNNSGASLNDVSFTDNLANGGLFFSEAMQTVNGIQVVGQAMNSSTANLTLFNVPTGVSSFEMAVDIPSGISQWSNYCNQASIGNLKASNPNLPDVISSDNPATSAVGDPTCVIVKKYENCCNGIDDDGDGLCDSDDPDCNK